MCLMTFHYTQQYLHCAVQIYLHPYSLDLSIRTLRQPYSNHLLIIALVNLEAFAVMYPQKEGKTFWKKEQSPGPQPIFVFQDLKVHLFNIQRML